MSLTISVSLNSYSSMKYFLKRFGQFLTKKIDFESQNFAIFDNFYSTDRNTSKLRPSLYDLSLYMRLKSGSLQTGMDTVKSQYFESKNFFYISVLGLYQVGTKTSDVVVFCAEIFRC